MIRYQCDKCGRPLGANDAERFIVRIEAFAAAGPMELDAETLNRDRTAEIDGLLNELARADPDRLEDQTFRSFRFDLCAACHRRFLQSPLT